MRFCATKNIIISEKAGDKFKNIYTILQEVYTYLRGRGSGNIENGD